MIVRRIRPAQMWPSSFAELESMRRNLNRLLDRFDDSSAEKSAGVYPPVNIQQNPNEFRLRVVLPGVAASDIELSVLRNTLTLSGERKIKEESKEVSYHRKERQEGYFKRSIELPSPIATDKVDASFKNGLLVVVLPKAEEAKPRQIAVSSV